MWLEDRCHILSFSLALVSSVGCYVCARLSARSSGPVRSHGLSRVPPRLLTRVYLPFSSSSSRYPLSISLYVYFPWSILLAVRVLLTHAVVRDPVPGDEPDAAQALDPPRGPLPVREAEHRLGAEARRDVPV